ncbi:hypothetical protein [uncultured Anaerococcus sp.]|uniref:hypothetical protein n=1 Tax=uncultured Anaerococcus sp. TaxID=293428 RepID=UPI00288BBD88|nr:hypothetical protein [uncultured Anaerococcus sp.]
MDSPFIDEVNKMIEVKTSLKDIKAYLNKQDFSISTAYLGRYRKIRKSYSAEENNLEDFIKKAPVKKLIEDQEKEIQSGSQVNKLKSDLEFLDMVIQSGSDQLKTLIKENDYLITIDNVFKAIELKDKLTDGALAGLTQFGIKNLQEITEKKYMQLLQSMFKYVPDEEKQKVLAELEVVEEDYYKETDYYEDYLRNTGKTEKEIQKKLKEVRADED